MIKVGVIVMSSVIVIVSVDAKSIRGLSAPDPWTPSTAAPTSPPEPTTASSMSPWALIAAASTSSTECSTAWNLDATDVVGTFTCGQRIDWLKNPQGGGMTDDAARDKVAAEFPSICGGLNAAPCSPAPTTSAPTLAPTTSSAEACDGVWDTPALGPEGQSHTCG